MNFRGRLLAATGAFALTAALVTPVLAADGVSDQDILDGPKNPTSVLSNGLGPKDQRFSILKKINKETIKGLVPAWSFSFGGEKQRGQESQALVKDGVLYVTGSYSRAYAVNAHTGEKIWEYDARLPEGILPCCDVVNRGGVLYHDKFIFGTLDAQLVALNAKTGKVDVEEGRSRISRPAIPTPPRR